MNSDSAVPGLNRNAAHSLKIKVPELKEQKRIADILGTFDNKIELNRQMNRTLEAMARALFKSWFVDFDPVYAKIEGRDYPLTAEVMDLFPDELVESELGLIPEGWRVKTINDVVEIVGGATPSTKNPDYWKDGIHNFATPKDLSGLSSPILTTTDRKVTDAGLLKISSRLLDKGTLLMSSRAPVGYLAITDLPVCINQGFIAMKCNRSLSNYYMLNWAQHNLEEIKGRAGGTTFKEISKRNFRVMDIMEPIKEIVYSYDELVKPIYDKITANIRESETLMKIRDTLLPELMSVEILGD
jgi:type I restriction enzyme S subunit